MQLHAEVQSVNGKHPKNVQQLIESLNLKFVAELYQSKTCHLSRIWGCIGATLWTCQWKL